MLLELKKKFLEMLELKAMIAGPSEITVVADKNTNVNEVLTSL